MRSIWRNGRKEICYSNVQHPMETAYDMNLPDGYTQVYGDELDENSKTKACHYGFHSEDNDGILTWTFREGAVSYAGRKQPRFYQDSFESLILNDWRRNVYNHCGFKTEDAIGFWHKGIDTSFYIRKYESVDCEQLAEVFYQTVHTIMLETTQRNNWMCGQLAQWIWKRGISHFWSMKRLWQCKIIESLV